MRYNLQIKWTKARILAAILNMLFLLALFMAAFQYLNNRTPYVDSFVYNTGWTVTLTNETIYDADLETLTFEPVQKGDIISIETTLPDQHFSDPMLRIWMCHSAIQVYVGKEKVYEYALERYHSGWLIGSGFHWIDLPDDCEGQPLKLIFYVCEPNALTNFDVPILGESEDAMPDFLSEHFLSGCAGIFLIVFGIALIVTTIFMMFFSKGFSQLVFTGAFSMIIGLWTLCNQGVIQ